MHGAAHARLGVQEMVDWLPRESSLKSIMFRLAFINVICYVLTVSLCVMPLPSFPDPLLS